MSRSSERTFPQALPGDLCLLLVPATPAQTDHPARVQAPLRRRYGGRFTQPLHLTCQRFRCEDAVLEALEAKLGALCHDTAPLPIEARSLIPFFSSFRDEEILKAKIVRGEALDRFAAGINAVLRSERIALHYPWVPELVTLLEGLAAPPEGPVECRIPLFLGARLVLSRIEAPDLYTPLFELPLGGARRAQAAD